MSQATTTKTAPTGEKRIPAVLAKETILADFCRRYLAVYDEISEYNAEVLAEKDAEWTAGKVLAKAREFASPEDGTSADEEIKSVYDAWEKLVTEVSHARKAVLDAASKKLGITLSATADRNAETEAPLKEKRKFAHTVGTQLSKIAEMTANEAASKSVTEFLSNYPLPAVGRDQVSTFGSDGSTTPKYRVTVTVSKDGNTLLEGEGFTKTALALTKPVFGYERGKALDAEKLRAAWEAAGNSQKEPYKVSPVKFKDNDLDFEIAKK